MAAVTEEYHTPGVPSTFLCLFCLAFARCVRRVFSLFFFFGICRVLRASMSNFGMTLNCMHVTFGHVPGHVFSPHLAVENLKLARIISKHVDNTI